MDSHKIPYRLAADIEGILRDLLKDNIDIEFG